MHPFLSKAVETSQSMKNVLQESFVKEKMESDCTHGETGEAIELSELPLRELNEGTKILMPDMGVIKTQSLEAVKQNNLEIKQVSIQENKISRELEEGEKQYLKENTSLSENAVNSIFVDIDGNYYLKCRNEDLAGKNHDVTGIKYVKKIVDVDHVKITVVVPEFPTIFECEIPAKLWEAGDKEIFTECTEKLKDNIEANPELKARFNEQQLEQITNNEPYIRGYTWHHSEIPGKMQLVETKIHAMSGHTGGNSIWCGGIR